MDRRLTTFFMLSLVSEYHSRRQTRSTKMINFSFPGKIEADILVFLLAKLRIEDDQEKPESQSNKTPLPQGSGKFAMVIASKTWESQKIKINN